MEAEKIKMPTLIFPGHLVETSFASNAKYRHRMGGPLELKLPGWPKKLPQPQRLFTLDFDDPALEKLGLQIDAVVGHLPLLYAFQVSSCTMKYEIESMKLLNFEGESEGSGWPYDNYPNRFPTVPLALKAPRRINWKQLERDDDWYGLTWQDSRPGPGEVLIVVPPNDIYGVSLWGEDGDDEQVQMVFRIDMKAAIIEAWNECT